jgi:type II secretory pathway component PulF
MVENEQKKESVGWCIASIIFFVFAILQLLSILGIQVSILTFKEVFDDFGAKLPMITELLINTSFRYVISVFAVLVMVALIIKEIKIKQKKRCFVLNIVCFGFCWLIIFVYIPAVFLLIPQMNTPHLIPSVSLLQSRD